MYTNRIISHPLFQNITLNEALKKLEREEIGEVVIRPSSKGTDHVTITWKLFPDLYVHVGMQWDTLVLSRFMLMLYRCCRKGESQ